MDVGELFPSVVIKDSVLNKNLIKSNSLWVWNVKKQKSSSRVLVSRITNKSGDIYTAFHTNLDEQR